MLLINGHADGRTDGRTDAAPKHYPSGGGTNNTALQQHLRPPTADYVREYC